VSKFIHELPEAKLLFETLGQEKKLFPAIVEKDYWVTHCLWGLQRLGFDFEMKGGTSLSKGWCCIDRFSEDIDIRFAPPKGLNVKSDSDKHVKARKAFYDELAGKMAVPGIAVERNRAYDDALGRNGGISLKYPSRFPALEALKPEVLLEVGFARTTPCEPLPFTSWAVERALKTLEIEDNRVQNVKCFNPEYTFVDKLQTICKRFRQHRAAAGPLRDRPREFLRHYYDLFRLLEVGRVAAFIGKPEYDEYKAEKLRGKDLEEFKTRDAFNLPDRTMFELFEREYASINTLLLSPGPSFAGLIGRFRRNSARF
jgi:hypothetical protein